MLGKTYSMIFAISFFFSVCTGNISSLGQECINGAVAAVKFMIELGTMMAFWCGIMAVFEKAGVLRFFAAVIRPVLKLIFPETTRNGTALQELSMNISANFLGLGNAATPMGIRAMEKMSKIPSASDDMIMLAVLNTASVQLIPTTLISLRMISGSQKPYEIIIPIWICSIITVTFAVIVTKSMAFLGRKRKKGWKT